MQTNYVCVDIDEIDKRVGAYLLEKIVPPPIHYKEWSSSDVTRRVIAKDVARRLSWLNIDYCTPVGLHLLYPNLPTLYVYVPSFASKEFDTTLRTCFSMGVKRLVHVPNQKQIVISFFSAKRMGLPRYVVFIESGQEGSQLPNFNDLMVHDHIALIKHNMCYCIYASPLALDSYDTSTVYIHEQDMSKPFTHNMFSMFEQQPTYTMVLSWKTHSPLNKIVLYNQGSDLLGRRGTDYVKVNASQCPSVVTNNMLRIYLAMCVDPTIQLRNIRDRKISKLLSIINMDEKDICLVDYMLDYMVPLHDVEYDYQSILNRMIEKKTLYGVSMGDLQTLSQDYHTIILQRLISQKSITIAVENDNATQTNDQTMGNAPQDQSPMIVSEECTQDCHHVDDGDDDVMD